MHADTLDPETGPSSSQAPTVPQSQVSSPRARGPSRNSAACQRCRKRKQRCDGVQPTCGQCNSSGVPCVPSRRIVLQGSACCQCEVLKDEVRTLRKENALLRGQQNPSSGHNLVTQSGEQAPHDDVLMHMSSGHGSTAVTPDSGTSTSFSCDRMLRPTFRRLNRANGAGLSSPWHLWDGLYGDGPTPAAGLETRPDTRDAAELIDQFFSRRAPQYPVLHKPTFWHHHYVPFSSGGQVSDLTNFMVYMVLAIGAYGRSTSPSAQPPQHSQFFQAAIRYLPTIFELDDVDVVRCLILLGIYGINEPQMVDLWYTIGVALRLAVGADLHCFEIASSADLVESQMRKRIFWSLYAMDRTVSIALGRPLGIKEADITVPYPMNLADDPVDTMPGSSATTSDLSTFLHLLELRRLKSEIYETMHMPSGNGSTDVVGIDIIRNDFQTRLDQWISHSPPCPMQTSMHQTQEWQRTAYDQAILMLYRPSRASPAPAPGSSDVSLRRCVYSAINLISGYATLYARNKVTYAFSTPVALFMAAVTMLYAIRADPTLRKELSGEVIDFNIRTCSTLLRKISVGQVGERSASIIERLCVSILTVYGKEHSGFPDFADDGGMNAEFMSWFGLQTLSQTPVATTPFLSSIDSILNGILGQEFQFPEAIGPEGFA